jgi:hypothetical protein
MDIKDFIDKMVVGTYNDEIAIIQLSTWINPQGYKLYVKPIYTDTNYGILCHSDDKEFDNHIRLCKFFTKEQIETLKK